MKSTRAIMTFTALAALGLLGAGCGDDGAGSSGSSGPTGEQKAIVQSSEGGSGTMDELTSISTKALIDDGSGGVATKSSVPGGASSATTAVINYQENVYIVLDLDTPGDDGNDLFPNATGRIGIAAAGSLVGDPTAGQIDYAVVVTALTDLVFTDPVSTCTATLAANGTFAHAVSISWSWTDDQNWTLSARCDAAITGFVLTVTDGTETWTATVDCARSEACTISAVAGQISLTCAVSGAKFVTLSNGVETHFVAIDVQGIGGVTVTVDGEVFGPWTAARVRAVWGVNIN